MKPLLFRFLVIGTLFLFGAFMSSMTGISYLALPIWYTAVLVWTLVLEFRKSLFVTIPFLLVTDVLWDGTLGAVFLCGFLLATATTYLAARIETRSLGLQNFLYSMLTGIFAFLVVAISFYFPDLLFPVTTFLPLLKILFIQLLLSALIFHPLSWYIHWVEQWLDTSYQEQIKKIR